EQRYRYPFRHCVVPGPPPGPHGVPVQWLNCAEAITVLASSNAAATRARIVPSVWPSPREKENTRSACSPEDYPVTVRRACFASLTGRCSRPVRIAALDMLSPVAA